MGTFIRRLYMPVWDAYSAVYPPIGLASFFCCNYVSQNGADANFSATFEDLCTTLPASFCNALCSYCSYGCVIRVEECAFGYHHRDIIIIMASNLEAMASNGLQPTSNGLQPKIDGGHWPPA